MDTLTGTIVVAQEGRFRLVTDSGQAHLFVLAPDAPLAAQDLPRLQRRQTRVAVSYTDAKDRIAFVAHDIAEPQAKRGRL